MKKILKWTKGHIRALAFAAGATVFVGGLLLVNLGDLVNGVSSREALLNFGTSSLSSIAHNPVGLPQHLLQWATGLLPYHNAFWLRLPSAVLAATAIAGLTYVMRRWYGPRTALFGFFLFSTSAWLLHAGRLATDDIALLWAVTLLLVSHVMLHHHTESKLALYFWLACNITLLYIPGMVWLVALNIILQRSELKEAFQNLRSLLNRLGLLPLALILFAPMVYGLATGETKTIGLSLLGLPTNLPSIHMLLANLRDALLFISIRGSEHADLWLNHLPLLDAFMTIALVAGAIFYGRHWRAGRSKLLGGLLILSLLLVVTGGPVTVGLIIPLLFVIIAAGIAYLLHVWLVVFPRNPIARGFGIGLVGAVITVSCLYSMRQYYVAWPHHPETQQAFGPHKIEPSRR